MNALYQYLDSAHVLHLATSGEAGPHVAALFYVRLDGQGLDGASLAWISTRDVLHSRHLLADPQAAASISPAAPAVGAVDGVQLRGTATLAPDQAAVRDRYLAAFPTARTWVESSPAHVFWVLRPTWARLIGTAEGRPTKSEWR